MRKLFIVMLVGMGLSKLFFGRVIPPEVRLTSTAGFNALAEPAAYVGAGGKKAQRSRRHAHAKGEKHYEPGWLPAHYEPGAWLKHPPHYEAAWLKQPAPVAPLPASQR